MSPSLSSVSVRSPSLWEAGFSSPEGASGRRVLSKQEELGKSPVRELSTSSTRSLLSRECPTSGLFSSLSQIRVGDPGGEERSITSLVSLPPWTPSLNRKLGCVQAGTVLWPSLSSMAAILSVQLQPPPEKIMKSQNRGKYDATRITAQVNVGAV